MSSRHPVESLIEQSWPSAGWKDLTIILALSGGADSVAMLKAVSALRQPGQGKIIVAHYNHRWRAAESDNDENFVIELCNQLEIHCEVGRAGEGTSSVSGTGLEEAAREARYLFFRQLANRYGARYVATAHTADDQAETILHRIVRGTGLSGLAGIPQSRPLSSMTMLIRPLLTTYRADILDYLKSMGQLYREDSSNRDLSFTRNRIRAELLPQLQSQYNKQVVDALLRMGDLAGQAQQVIDNLVQDLIQQAVEFSDQKTIRIDISRASQAEPYLVRELLIAIWKDRGWPLQAMSYEKWNGLATLMLHPSEAGVTKQVFPGNIGAEKKDGSLWLTRLDD